MNSIRDHSRSRSTHFSKEAAVTDTYMSMIGHGPTRSRGSLGEEQQFAHSVFAPLPRDLLLPTSETREYTLSVGYALLCGQEQSQALLLRIDFLTILGGFRKLAFSQTATTSTRVFCIK